MKLFIGAVLGGPELENGHIHRYISLIRKASEQCGVSESTTPALDVVFHVPGSMLPINFEGLRTAKFSKNQKMLMIQVAVPKNIQGSDLESFILASLRRAAELAQPVFQKAKIVFDAERYLHLINLIENHLHHQ